MKTQAILPTAGTGTRLKTDTLKPFIELKGKPLCVYALEAFEKSPVIDSVILVGQKTQLEQFEKIVQQYDLNKVNSIVAGGETRRESVSNGLAALHEDTGIVVIHDGARPLVSLENIKDAVLLCQDWDAVVTALPVKPTIKKVNSETLCVEETLNREELWEVQTPQAFKKDVLLKAHKANKIKNPTDDAAMVEQLGVKVKVTFGDDNNIKVTTKSDLAIVETLLQAHETMVKAP